MTTAGRVSRRALAGGLLAGAVLAAFSAPAFTWLETLTCAFLTRALTGMACDADPARSLLSVTGGADYLFAVQVGLQCSVAIPFTVLLTVCAGAVLRLNPVRTLAGLALAAAVVYTVNQLRLVMILWAGGIWGPWAGGGSGFDISHRFLGSAVTLLGLIAALAVVFAVALGLRGAR